jgi:hypothetical protein
MILYLACKSFNSVASVLTPEALKTIKIIVQKRNMPELSEISCSCQVFNLTPVNQDNNYIFQQDGATSHTSIKSRKNILQKLRPEFTITGLQSSRLVPHLGLFAEKVYCGGGGGCAGRFTLKLTVNFNKNFQF